MSLMKRSIAECIGTFWLVFGGCGAALLACGADKFGIGYVGVSLAFGLTVLTMAFAIGHISGCHLNPAVTIGLYCAGRFKNDKGQADPKEVAYYIIAQCAGGLIAAFMLWIILGQPSFDGAVGTFATNGWSNELVNGHNAFGGQVTGAGPAFIIEAILTCVFLLVIIGSTDRRAPAGFAPIAIGLCLTLIHLISIPVTNTSVNPARSIAMAVFNQGESLSQLWLFIVAPIAGAIVAAYIYKTLFEAEEKKPCCCKCKCDHKDDEVEEKEEDKKEEKKEVKEEDKKEEKVEE